MSGHDSYAVVLGDLRQRRAALVVSLQQIDTAIATLEPLVASPAPTAPREGKARPARPTPAPGTDLHGRILAALDNGPLSVSQVAAAVGVEGPVARYRLGQLVDQQLLVRVGKTSQAKYRRV